MKKLILVVFVLSQLYATTLFAQNEDDKIDHLMQSYAAKHKFSGNVLVAKNGSAILQKSYGIAHREWNINNSDSTRFRIASLSKQFTAVLIMQLVEDGKINLKAPITTYLSYYDKTYGDSINVHHLLSHTSGLSEFTERPDFFADISKREFSHKEFIERFCSDKPISSPGTAYKYTNTGYYILGAIIEEVTGQSFADALQKRILDVLEMKNTGVEVARAIVPNRAKGYNYQDGKFSNSEYIDLSSTIFAAGSMYSTTEDLLKWDRALHSGTILPAKSREKMFTPVLANYGYGVGVTKFMAQDLNKEMHFIFHQGAINGFRSMMTHVVNEDLLIVMLCNNFDVDLNPINNSIFAILHNQPYSLAQ
jgi:CubicO group peptidase (beta-lactamase class C family)